MNTETIEKLKKLPPDKQQEVDDFVDFLINKLFCQTGIRLLL